MSTCSSFDSADLQSISHSIEKLDPAWETLQTARSIFIARYKKKEGKTTRSSINSGDFVINYGGCKNARRFNADSNSQMSPVEALQASQKLLFTDRCFSGYHPHSHSQSVHL